MANLESTLSLLDIRRAMTRYYVKALAFWGATLMVVAIIALVWPRTYVSEARMYVKLGRTSVRLDPTATTGETVTLMESRETEINSILEVLRSRALAEGVVDVLGVETILSGGETASEPGKRSWLGAVAGLPGAAVQSMSCWLNGTVPASSRDKAIDEVIESLGISTPRRTNVIAISCRASSPQLAQKIAAAVLEQFQIEHVRVNRTAGSFDFFDQETQRLAESLRLAASRVREAKNTMGVASIEGQRTTLQNQLEAVERDRDATMAQLAAARARSDSLLELIQGLPERLTGREEQGLPNIASDTMRNELYQLEIRERELLSKYTAKHPTVVALREQVDEARRILNEQPAERTQRSSDVNPARQELQLRRMTEQAEIEALVARQQSLQSLRAGTLARIHQLNDGEVQLGQLQREAEQLERDYRLSSEKLAQARTDRQLDQQRISNVNVFQPATLVVKPVSPRLGMLAVFGMAFGGLGAVGLALVSESIDRSLRTPDEVERQLELPVLVALPRMAPDHVLLN